METSVSHAPHSHHDHHGPLPSSGRALDAVAVSATLHCLTGCAIGEVLGMIIGTALGFSDWATIALAVALAFFFGYSLTSLPLLRSGLALAAVIPIALASDTLSIAVMEIVDNAIMVIVPGAMEAGVGDVLFWGALSVALVVAGVFAFPVNRWLIARGRGHAVVHETGVHGGPPTRAVAAVAVVAAVFGTTVLIADAVGGGEDAGHGPDGHRAAQGEPKRDAHGATGGSRAEQDAVRGLSASDAGLTLKLDRTTLPVDRRTELAFRIVDDRGRAVRDFQVEHEKRMHLIVVRRDLTGFQHLHPKLAADGTWSVPATIPETGTYRVFADFKHDGRNLTLADDVTADRGSAPRELPGPSTTAATAGGYEVRLGSQRSRAGQESELRFTVLRDRRPVDVEPYLGAGGHLVALREGDLAFLHVHPVEHGGGKGEHQAAITFATAFPTGGRYRLFLQFKHEGRVRTAAFTHEVPVRTPAFRREVTR
jgi:hypothetical protein